MFTKPEDYWTHITIEDWTDRCTAVWDDDIPVMFLEVFDDMMKDRLEGKYERPRFMHFDAEGWNYYLILNFWDVHIVSEPRYGDEEYDSDEFVWKHWDFPICITKLAAELINDVRRDLDEWAEWPDTRQEDIPERRKKLEEMCDAVERRLKETISDMDRHFSERPCSIWEKLYR